MALQTTTNISVDFYDKKYILVNAKQHDKNSRFLLITCYNHGELYPINPYEHSAYIRYKKSDNSSVFNFCKINEGKILVELTEQMLASDGICYADLVIVNKGDANVDTETGEIVTIDDASILSTMTFCIDVSETVVENSNIESSYEFNGLNEALQKANAEYTKVIQLAKSYAMGDADDIRENENIDNAKYYYEQSKKSADNSQISEHNAMVWATGGTLDSNTEAILPYEMKGAQQYAEDAQKYYSEMTTLVETLNGNVFVPKGTVSFTYLQSITESGDVKVGDLYHIDQEFTTDETFGKGAGYILKAGTNVYWAADNCWYWLVSAAVTGVKGDNESDYRKGNVNITAENVGAVATADIVTADEMKNYLGI